MSDGGSTGKSGALMDDVPTGGNHHVSARTGRLEFRPAAHSRLQQPWAGSVHPRRREVPMETPRFKAADSRFAVILKKFPAAKTSCFPGRPLCANRHKKFTKLPV